MKMLLPIVVLSLLDVCYIESKNMTIIAHRGASGLEPENTMRSFNKAIELRADMIEFDVHECATGEIVIIHDDTLDRTTNGNGEVCKTPLAGLERLNAGKGEHIPTLQKVLEQFRNKIKLNIELKGKHTGEPVAYLLHEHIYHYNWSVNDIVVTSFDHNELLKLHKIMPIVQLGALFDIGDEIAFDSRFSYIVVPYEVLTQELVKHAHDHTVKVFTYTLNEPGEISHAMACKVDGIISDRPDTVRSVLFNKSID